MRVVIVDYGMGNIKSIKSALNYLNVDVIVSNKYKELKNSDKLLLPGVGSFKKAIDTIKNLELDKILEELVLENKKPILGICLGMQLLVKSSEEGGFNKGLGFVNAECKKFDISLRVPHIGFNQVKKNKNSILFREIEDESDFYFVHSYRIESSVDIRQSFCEYEEKFVASFEKDNIFGVQFHPEISQTNGLKLLDNFLKGS